jgi:hypothetical protein
MTISRWLHYLFFADSSESLCSRAYRLRHGSDFWAAWVRMFGARHCKASYLYYWRHKT